MSFEINGHYTAGVSKCVSREGREAVLPQVSEPLAAGRGGRSALLREADPSATLGTGSGAPLPQAVSIRENWRSCCDAVVQ
jgi:hypothetical protein